MKRLLFSCCALTLLGTAATQAQEYGTFGYPADVARNQYVPGVPYGDAGAIGASLYVSPRPVPPMVGHTFITYEGLMPDQLLYQHQRTYYRPHGPYGGVTQTNINWGHQSHLHPFGLYHSPNYNKVGWRENLRRFKTPQERMMELQMYGTPGGADCYNGGEGVPVNSYQAPQPTVQQSPATQNTARQTPPQKNPLQQSPVQQAFATTPAQKAAARK